MAVSNVELKVDGRSATRELNRVNAAVGRLQGAVGGLVAGFGAFQALKFAVIKTAELERQTKSLQVLTGSLEDAKSIIKELQDFGAVTPFTSAELIETSKRLKAFGVETNKLVDTTKRLGDVAGATGADLDGIATAYGQIQAKGKLQTEELLQLQERGVDLSSTLRREYNLTGEEFSKALEKGQISAEAVEFALKELTDTGGQYANGAIAQSDTLSGKFSTLQDNVGRFAAAIGEILSPALKGILDQINDLIGGFNVLFEMGGVEKSLREVGVLDDIVRKQVYDEAFKEAERLSGLGRVAKADVGTKALEIYQESLKGMAVEAGLIKPKIAGTAIKLPELTKTTTSNTKTKSAASTAKEAERAARAAQRQAEAIARSRLDSEQLIERLQMQVAIEQEINPIKKIQLQNALEQLEIQQRYGNLIASEEDAITRINLKQAQSLEFAATEAKQFAELVELIERAGDKMGSFLREKVDANTVADKLDGLYKSIGNSIQTGIVDSLTAAVEGTKSLAEVASDTLKSLASILLKFGLQTFLGGLGGGDPTNIFTKLFGGGKASGGTVKGGTSYLVGERGPELFTPGRSGSIAPNNSLGGATNIVVNVDASNANAKGGSAQSKQLGKAIGLAVQAELVKQKRPGGLLASR